MNKNGYKISDHYYLAMAVSGPFAAASSVFGLLVQENRNAEQIINPNNFFIMKFWG